jgi:hypothetical protein
MLIRDYPDGRTTPRAAHHITYRYPKRKPTTGTTRYADRELVMHYLTHRE